MFQSVKCCAIFAYKNQVKIRQLFHNVKLIWKYFTSTILVDDLSGKMYNFEKLNCLRYGEIDIVKKHTCQG